VVVAGKSFVLVIGIDTYETMPTLRWASADAIQFYETFIRGRADDEVESLLLLNEAASATAIRAAFGEWLPTALPGDNVVAYFAGHGARELPPGRDLRTGAEAYLLPADVDSKHLYSTAISLTHELPNLLGRIRANNTVAIFDCCFAGGGRADHGERARGIDGPNFALAHALAEVPLNVAVVGPSGSIIDIGDGVVALMACGPNESAFERDDLQHGVFTYHLLEAFRQTRSQGQDHISVGRTYADLVEAVGSDTRMRQIPILDGRLSRQSIYLGG
jgi:uncharacterized caspase-like protein